MRTAYNLTHDLDILDIDLRQLTGYDERYNAHTKNLPSFKRSINLLNRLIIFSKDYPQLTDAERIDKIFKFTIGQRTTLMLSLRKFIFGDKFQCIVKCNHCKSDLSLDISIDTILQLDKKNNNADTDIQTKHDLKIDNFSIKIRPLNGYDQENLFYSSIIVKNENSFSDEEDSNNTINKNNEKSQIKTLTGLAKSSIVYSEPSISEQENLPLNIISAISQKLEQIDPISNLTFNLICYNCNHHFQTSFYAEEFILDEIDIRYPQLEWEIHWIAFNYHWSEKEILSLPINHRKKYIELINKTLSE